MHLNGDETVALGSAFRAANVSTAFKPRFVGMTDISPFSIGVEFYRSMNDDAVAPLAEESEMKEEQVDPDTPMSNMEEEKKNHGIGKVSKVIIRFPLSHT